MKKHKKSYLLIVLVIMLIAIAVGYAAFSQSLKISGTAKAVGEWDVHFETAEINDQSTDDQKTCTATVNTDKTEVTVNVQLSYPGDGHTITTTIKNNGTIPAKLTGFTVKDKDGNAISNDYLEIITPNLATDGTEKIEANQTCAYEFGVKWKTDAPTTSTTIDQTVEFTIAFNYEQATDEVTVNPSHNAHT